MKYYENMRVAAPKQVTSPTWGFPPPYKQALKRPVPYFQNSYLALRLLETVLKKWIFIPALEPVMNFDNSKLVYPANLRALESLFHIEQIDVSSSLVTHKLRELAEQSCFVLFYLFATYE